MAVTPRLDLRQVQGLVMTPQLQQAIKLLQLNNVELAEYVETELEQNPLLERAEGPEGGEGGESAGDGDYAEASDGGEGEAAAREGDLQAVDRATDNDSTSGNDEALDMGFDDRWDADAPAQAVGTDSSGLGEQFGNWSQRGGGFDGDDFGLEQTLSETVSLRDHLNEQIGMDIVNPVERLIAGHLLDMLDEKGYLTGDLDQVADTLGCSVAEVETVLDLLQRFDPPGIFARDLAECLSLQLRDRDRLDPAMEAFLANLDLLAKRDMAGLKKACGVDEEDIADMVTEIRALNPRPAGSFDQGAIQPVTPDVIMKPHPDGGWTVELNSEMLPRVLVNNAYYARIKGNAKSDDDKRYIAECFQSASWLVKSLHQRATTILKVASELVRQQDAFFAKGVQYLKPLVLRDIAEAIEMHESTVSRVTSNKYMATPRGIFELKYFFTTAINATEGGEALSSESVRHRIRALIDAEDPKKVLSDDKLVALLRDEGMDIARRTVAKYRESLGIASSVQRRREKAGGF